MGNARRGRPPRSGARGALIATLLAALGFIAVGCGGGSPSRVEPDTRMAATGRTGQAGPTRPTDSAGAAPDRAAAPSPGDSVPGPLWIHVLRVTSRSGGGDAILVADSTVVPARHALIDAGDGGEAAAALERLGVSALDLMVLTHAHHDHYGGMGAVLAAVPVRAFAFTGQPRTATTYRRLLERIEESVPLVIVVDSVRRIRFGDGEDATVLTLIPPLPTFLDYTGDDGVRLNEASLAVRVERGAFAFLTTGDAEIRANRWFASNFAELVDVDVLKLGHHGSSDATQPFWLDATTPAVAVISANGTTHPYAAVIALVEERGVELFCTPQHGDVRIRVDRDGGYMVLTDAPPGVRCEPGSRAP